MALQGGVGDTVGAHIHAVLSFPAAGCLPPASFSAAAWLAGIVPARTEQGQKFDDTP